MSSLPDGGARPAYLDATIYMYFVLIYNIYYLFCLCIDFYDLPAGCGCWFVVYIRWFIYKKLNVCPFDCTVVAESTTVCP